MRDKVIIALLLAIGIVLPLKVLAHPGNTASDGCHYCKTNCASWGEIYGARHCHSGSTTTSISPLYDKAFSHTLEMISKITSLQMEYGASSVCDSIELWMDTAEGRISSGKQTLQNLRSLSSGCGLECIDLEGYIGQYSDYLSFLKKIDTISCSSPNLGVTTQKSCPPNSSGTWGTCSCYSGYVWKNDKCVAMNDHCKSKYGSNSYGAIDGKETVCRCNKGYGIVKGKCISLDNDCKNNYGVNSYSLTEGGKSSCYCKDGYKFNSANTQCIKKYTQQPVPSPSIERVPLQKADKELHEPQENCFPNSLYDAQSSKCKCIVGYGISVNKSYCVKIPTNAHYIDSPTDIWLCDKGYKELGNSCVPIEIEDTVIPEADNTEIEAVISPVDNDSMEEKDHQKPKGFWGFIKSFFR